MKHSSKLFSLYLSAVLFWGCLPQEKLTGRVIDLTGPVPEAAVLGMVWMEDADKAKSAPVLDSLTPEERNAAYETDMKERGLPAAYARAFADEKGRFTLDKLHFSGETKKAVKAMKQPKITRITLNAFQRGYLKRAVTSFTKGKEELPDATIILFKPANWKELSLDSSFSSLERPEYYNGYSKEFGATKREKNWFLDYTHSNLYKAYVESDIKGNKDWEKYCGHDYSDIIISTAGMYRNPAHERCGELLKRMGDVRANEELWGNHALKPAEWIETAKGRVQEAIAGLGIETSEPREYEREILAGMETGNRSRKETGPVNWLEESTTRLEEAKILYGKGDKAAAYRALGQAIHAQMRTVPEAATITTIIPAIKDAVAGFYLLMNKPLTAQAGASGQQTGQTKTASEAGKETGKGVGISTGTAKKDYRIEMEKNKEEQPIKVKFIAPDGKVIKTLPAKGWPYKMTLITGNGKYVLYTPEEYMGDAEGVKVDEQGYLDYTVSLYDAKGDQKWKKEFKTYPQHSGIEGVEEPWDNGISDDGERIYVNYCDEKSTYTLTVFNTEGEEIANVRHNLLLSEIKISPDGKIVGAETIIPGKDDNLKHLFFLEVDTGKTKLVRAQNAMGFGEAFPYALKRSEEGYKPLLGYVTLGWNYWNHKLKIRRRSEQIVIEFNKLPGDMAELIKPGGEEK